MKKQDIIIAALNSKVARASIVTAQAKVAISQAAKDKDAVTVTVSVKVDGRRCCDIKGDDPHQQRHAETGMLYGDEEVDWRYDLRLLAYPCNGGGLAVGPGLPCITPCRMWVTCALAQHPRMVYELPCANTRYDKCKTRY
jgi:hypothetical protein